MPDEVIERVDQLQGNKDEPQVDDNWTIDKESWNKTQQELDQAKSVAEKATKEAQQAREDAETYAASLEENNQKIADLQKQVATQQKAVEVEGNKLEAMDDALVDKAVINNFAKMKADLESVRTELGEAKGKISQYETIEQGRIAETQKNQTIERILTPLDSEFGAKFRNPAKKLADELVDSGDEPQPKDAIEAMVLMRKCYTKVVEKATKKDGTPADAGGGGVPPPPEKKGQGTPHEVLADMRKTKSWKT
jgi:chromosome segregation ATPase